ncbi:MAG: MFS transporter [Pseudomonadota bacterium]
MDGADPAVPDATTSQTRVSQPTRLAYGIGSLAYATKDNAFNYFLLFFYSQVLGVPASLAGLVLSIALALDAISDPMVGLWSDKLHSRWGRRHPFMYVSALPVAVSFYLIFNPPLDWNEEQLLWYLAAMTIAVRLSITFYEVPSIALVSELTQDYDERTILLSYRYFFAWFGGLATIVFVYQILLQPNDKVANGYFNIDGYGSFGLIGSLIIFTTILISAMGTHHCIPSLSQPPEKHPFSIRRSFGELRETLSNPSFIAVVIAILVFGLGVSLASALSIYFNNFFWSLTPTQTGLITAGGLIAAPIGSLAAPKVGKRFGKKPAALWITGAVCVITPLPIILRLLGLFPENGDPLLFPLLTGIIVFDLALIITSQILIVSMIADIPEDSEIRTGRRSEGTFFAIQAFARKCISGIGVLLAGAILDFVNFPTDGVTQVTEDMLNHLALIYIPVLLGVYIFGLTALSFYRINREQHAANLKRLKTAS